MPGGSQPYTCPPTRWLHVSMSQPSWPIQPFSNIFILHLCSCIHVPASTLLDGCTTFMYRCVARGSYFVHASSKHNASTAPFFCRTIFVAEIEHDGLHDPEAAPGCCASVRPHLPQRLGRQRVYRSVSRQLVSV